MILPAKGIVVKILLWHIRELSSTFNPLQESAELVIERNKAEMFLKIVGFRVEVKAKEVATWENATVIDFVAGANTPDYLYHQLCQILHSSTNGSIVHFRVGRREPLQSERAAPQDGVQHPREGAEPGK